MTNRSRAALLLALSLLVCCAAPAFAGPANNCSGGGRPRPDDGGIGGTGAHPIAPSQDDSGIGGTGARPLRPDEDDSGIGGTGVSAHANTGVIGIITGFASICVGDTEIRYDANSVVEIDGRAAPAAQLAVGQMVEVVASGTDSELSAQRIAVRHVVAGPVTSVDLDRNQIEVIGQTVRLPRDMPPDGSGGESSTGADLPIGTFVRISGMRQGDGVIVASLVSRAPTEDAVQVTGPVTSSASGLLTIAGTQVRVDDGTAVSAGDEVRVVGRWDGRQVTASSIDPVPRVPFDGQVARVQIEGYASRAADGRLRVGSFLFDLTQADARGATQELASDALVRVQAVIEDRRAIVERIGPAPELPPRIQPRDGMPQVQDGNSQPGNAPRGDGAGPGDRNQPPPAAGAGPMPDRPPDGRELVAPPPRPDRPDRPPLPDRPPQIDRPPAPPERLSIPERPPHIDRPPRPGHP